MYLSEFRKSSTKTLTAMLLVVATTVLVTPFAATATVLGTGDPTVAACCFGDELDGIGRTNVRTIGQTFVAPTSATSIQNFSFWLQDFNGEGASLQYKAYLMDWDSVLNGGIATGPVLFASAIQSGSTQASLEKVTFAPAGGVAVSPENDYVIFLSTLEFSNGDSRNAVGSFPFNPTVVDAYLDGNGVVFTGPSGNQSDPFSAITDLASGGACTNCWNALSPYADMAFEVEFAGRESTVAEPVTFTLMGLGLLGASFGRKRRSR